MQDASKNIIKKRGRKKDLEKKNEGEEKLPKKRGRKPKGGKIISSLPDSDNNITVNPNIILHLKCSVNDLNNNIFLSETESSQLVESFQFESKNLDQNYHVINDINSNIINPEMSDDSDNDQEKTINNKLQELAYNLKFNNISDKKSACFWCTCDFDNPPIYIPKFELSNSYQCYGCFCSPECATAFLFGEDIDTASKFERYHILNHIYCKIYDYKKNIKPAPNPHYTLNKFFGNLTIQEYRKQLQNERLLLVVDKPLTTILPELHYDNDEFIINNNIIPSSNTLKIKKKSRSSKSDILSENFNLHNKSL